MKYVLEIIEGKKKRERVIDIERVPYKVHKIAQKVEVETERARNLATESAELAQDMKANNDRIKEIEKGIRQIGHSGFFDLRFSAIKLILSVNGIDDDDELMNIETWETKMDYSVPMSFIYFAINKDLLPDKKKA